MVSDPFQAFRGVLRPADHCATPGEQARGYTGCSRGREDLVKASLLREPPPTVLATRILLLGLPTNQYEAIGGSILLVHTGIRPGAFLGARTRVPRS